MYKKHLRILSAVLALSLVATACGDDAEQATEAPAQAPPETEAPEPEDAGAMGEPEDAGEPAELGTVVEVAVASGAFPTLVAAVFSDTGQVRWVPSRVIGAPPAGSVVEDELTVWLMRSLGVTVRTGLRPRRRALWLAGSELEGACEEGGHLGAGDRIVGAVPQRLAAAARGDARGVDGFDAGTVGVLGADVNEPR